MRAALARPAGLALLAATVAGCALFAEAPKLPCPRVVAVDDLSRLTLYRPGPGRDLTDVRLETEITELDSRCDYGEAHVDVDVDVTFVVTRGPAAGGGASGFDYFVAIADGEQRIIAKRIFTVVPRFPPKTTRIALTEQLTQRIFLDAPAAAREHRVYVGFQLTRAQLEELRRRQSRRGAPAPAPGQAVDLDPRAAIIGAKDGPARPGGVHTIPAGEIGRQMARHRPAPKEQPPRKLSGKRTAGG